MDRLAVTSLVWILFWLILAITIRVIILAVYKQDLTTTVPEFYPV